MWEFYAWVYNALPRYVKHRGYFISQAFVSLREMRLWVTFNFMNKHFIATPAWIFAFYWVSFLSTLLLNNKLMKGTLGNFSTKTNRTRFWKVWHTFHSFLWDAIRGGTRLNGVPMFDVWTWGISEANVLYWRKYLWHFWNFSAHSAVIWRPIVIRCPGNCPPFSPSLHPWMQCLPDLGTVFADKSTKETP